jgi:iron complex transport system substrate-binding protein
MAEAERGEPVAGGARGAPRWLVPAAILALVFVGSWVARGRLVPASPPPGAGGDVRRVVSLAPSVTESLFALGLGDRVVGVTRYCAHPPEVRTLPRIGGYDDPNYEAIVALRPDLVVGLPRHAEHLERLRRQGLVTLAVQEGGVARIVETLEVLGRTCGAAERAAGLVDGIRRRMSRVENRTRDLARPRVLVTVGRNMGSGGIKDVYVAGRDGFYDEMIRLAGGANPAAATALPFPRLSPEGITRLNPEVIVDMVDDPERGGSSVAAIVAEWDALAEVAAVRDRRVHVISGDRAVVPGPRFVEVLEELARLLHPEVDWGRP